MCGIVGYLGKERAAPFLIDGLKALEYRGYDSAGVVVIDGNDKVVEKAVGKVAALEDRIGDWQKLSGKLGLAHTRWATHGGVTELNAHPHSDCRGEIWLAHNGIIENYKELKEKLELAGHKFKSETDTEVIAHLIEEFIRRGESFKEATSQSLRNLKGTYGLVIINIKEPETLIAARNFSPLLIGLGEGEYFIASDASAVIRHTKNVIYLDDEEMVIISPGGYHIYDLGLRPKLKKPEFLDWDVEAAEKSGYPHFMLKEIIEEPDAVRNSIRGRLLPEEGRAVLGGLREVTGDLRKTRRIMISACGSSYFAGKVGEYMLEEYGGIPTEVELGSEFRYRKPIFEAGDVFLAISQSGETADTLASLREAKEKGVLTLGIVNVVGSTVSRATDAGVYQHVGPEIGVASTKSFVSQVAILGLLSLFLGRQRVLSLVMGKRIAKEFRRLPELMDKILEQKEEIKALAEKYHAYNNFLFLGRKYNFPTALEGALKLKEISYVHAEAYAAGEMKHGPIALIDENFPTVAIAPQDSVYEKNLSNLEEIKARGGPILAIATEGDEAIKSLADDVFYIPKTLEMLTPILSILPLHLFAYYIGVLRGCDVDKPRNLAKSVTVE